MYGGALGLDRGVEVNDCRARMAKTRSEWCVVEDCSRFFCFRTFVVVVCWPRLFLLLTVCRRQHNQVNAPKSLPLLPRHTLSGLHLEQTSDMLVSI